MTSAFWTLMLIVTATALVFHFMPRFTRPDIPFGVTVPEAFVAGAGRTLVSRYRVRVCVSAAVTLAIGLLLRARQDESGVWSMLNDGCHGHQHRGRPQDPAMWVENRFGLVYTLNFGNWRAWRLIIAMMLFPMVAGRLLF